MGQPDFIIAIERMARNLRASVYIAESRDTLRQSRHQEALPEVRAIVPRFAHER